MGNGPAVAAVGAGVLLVYSGVTGRGILPSIVNLVQGKSPGGVAPNQLIQGSVAPGVDAIAAGAQAVAGGVQAAASGANGSPKQILQSVAATHGWTGAQWTALDAIEMQEAGYDTTNKNPSSGAFGLAQSLGHGFKGGPAANGVNEYGGEGLSPSQSAAASMGDAYWQSVWMCNYIADRYGNPAVAEQFHLAHNWY